MTDTKNETPERIWVNLDASEDGCCPIAEDISIENIPDRGRFFHLPTATEYVRADLLADTARQRDEARSFFGAGWQPIELAPIGEEVLGFWQYVYGGDTNRTCGMTLCTVNSLGQVLDMVENELHNPGMFTHFLALPKPPPALAEGAKP